MPDVSAYKRILLLTEGNLGVFTSKTATVLLRFRGEDVVGVGARAGPHQVLDESFSCILWKR